MRSTIWFDRGVFEAFWSLFWDRLRISPASSVVGKKNSNWLRKSRKEIHVKPNLLIAVRGIVNLLPNILERFHSLCHFLETPIDLTCESVKTHKLIPRAFYKRVFSKGRNVFDCMRHGSRSIISRASEEIPEAVLIKSAKRAKNAYRINAC